MKIHAVNLGNFRLDGGAMFGVVPKVLWQKHFETDAENRIDISMRSLLIEQGDRLILIDTGLGTKQSEKFFGRYGLWGEHDIEKVLKPLGFHPDDITDVLLTHLHFDHCGGAIHQNKKGILEPYFKNATFWSYKDHWEWATKPNARERASFLSENILPIQESGQLQLLSFQEQKYVYPTPIENISVILVDGHTDKQMIPVINYKGATIVFTADLIPTLAHLSIPYIASYDTRPLLSLEEKQTFLAWAYKNKSILCFEHDFKNELISLKKTEKGIIFDEKDTINSFF